MTIGAIILDISLILGALLITVLLFSEDSSAGIISLLVSVIIVGAIIAFQFWYYGNTASGSRALKSQDSELQNGIERSVKVYDVNGQLIQQYEGKFDVTYDESRILFDDENGKRHIVYYTTGTVIIDEK